jgi:superfamily II DNA or RNA helicase
MTISVKHYGRGEWGIRSSSYSPILRQEAKLTPGMRWEPSAFSWIGYADAVAATIKRAKAKGLIIQGETPRPLDGREVSLVPLAVKGLRDYQTAGVNFLVCNAASGALLADDLGLGKSCQALIAARGLRSLVDGGKTIVVCPSHARGVWADEAKKWWPKAKVVTLSTTKPTPIDILFDIVIIHQDILYAWAETLIAWAPRTLIGDELHNFQGERARRTQAMMKLARVTPNRIGLSGTPMTSRPKDLWAPVDILSEGRFGKPFAFYLRYCDAKREEVSKDKVVWTFKGATNLDELHDRMSFFMLRRLKSEVALELPSRTRQMIEVDIAKGNIVAPTQAMRSDRILRKSLDMSADGKIPQVIDLVCSHLESGAKVVVGCYRKAVAEAVAEGVGQKMAATIRVITGDVLQPKRDAILKEQPQLLCCTLDSTKTAINLSFANVAVVAELVWVPNDLVQWEGRFGRVKGANILIQYIIARKSADEIIKAVCLAKLDRFHEAIGKTDDKLKEDFAGLEAGGAAARLQTLWESLKGDDE